jgi:hypothetical protein
MIELTIIEKTDTPAAWLEQFKAYAGIADNAQDSLLQAILSKAVLSVQQKADRSLIACTFELREDEVEGNAVRLYQSVSQVVSVRDGQGRTEYWEQVGNKVKLFANSAIVTYRTEPHLADIDTLLPIVYQYATALYDGEDSKTLASILTQC